MSKGSLARPRRRSVKTVEAEALRAEIDELATQDPNPWQTSNSRIAAATQEIAVLRREARALWSRHQDDEVRANYRAVARLARRIGALADFLARE
jgi:hypothetical protein